MRLSGILCLKQKLPGREMRFSLNDKDRRKNKENKDFDLILKNLKEIQMLVRDLIT